MNKYYKNYNYYNNYTKRQKGQVILLLILVMTVALAIGLSIVQKSLVDVSTASKVEQSSRAFSAAEAGIEKALNSSGDASCTNCGNPLDNFATIKQIEDSALRPGVSSPGIKQAALEYDAPLAKEDVAQVWLADPKANLPDCTGFVCYTQSTIDVFWGNSETDKAALEVTLVYFGTDPLDPILSERSVRKYRSKKWYLDHLNAARTNGFETVNCTGFPVDPAGTKIYQCKKTLDFTPTEAAGLMLIRARLLYNNNSQPFAVGATETCGAACSLPPQARSIISTGVSGETQRKVELFQLYNVVPPYFDYAIFSAGPITK